MPVDATIAEWSKDPEFQALPPERKASIVSNYFLGTHGKDPEFAGLEDARKKKITENFLSDHADLLAPSKSPPPDAGDRSTFSKVLDSPFAMPLSDAEALARGGLAGVESVLGGMGDIQAWGGDVLAKTPLLPKSVTGWLAEGGRDVSRAMREAQETGIAAPTPEEQTSLFKKAPYLVGQAVPSLAAALGISMAATPLAGAASLGLLEGAGQRREAKEAGLGEFGASTIGLLSTAGNTLLEKLPLDFLLKGAGGRAPRAIIGAGAESAQEATQQVWQNLLAKYGYDKARSLMEGVPESAIGAAGAGGIAGAAITPPHLRGARAPAFPPTGEEVLSRLRAGLATNSVTSVQASGIASLRPELADDINKAIIEMPENQALVPPPPAPPPSPSTAAPTVVGQRTSGLRAVEEMFPRSPPPGEGINFLRRAIPPVQVAPTAQKEAPSDTADRPEQVPPILPGRVEEPGGLPVEGVGVEAGATGPVVQEQGQEAAGTVAGPAAFQPVATGEAGKFFTPDDAAHDFQYAVVNADQLITSNDDDFRVNPAFPKDLQPRDRSRAANQLRVEEMANKLNPELLAENRLSAFGAPIVGPDGVVESGNGRAMAIRKAYQAGPKGEEYMLWPAENAERFGIDPMSVASVENPVLVRVRTSEVASRRNFVKLANRSEVARMSPAEQARADSQMVTSEDMALFRPSAEGDIGALSNADFNRRFVDGIGTNEAAGLVTSDGRLTRQATDRIQSAIFYKAYEDDSLISLQAEEAHPDVKNILRALVIASGEFARARGVDPALTGVNIPPAIVEGVELFRRSRIEGAKSVEPILAQGSLFGGHSAEGAAIARFIGKNIRKPNVMGETFREMGRLAYQELLSRGQKTLFERQALTKTEIISKVAGKGVQNAEETQRQADLFGETVRPDEAGGRGGEPKTPGRVAPAPAGRPATVEPAKPGPAVEPQPEPKPPTEVPAAKEDLPKFSTRPAIAPGSNITLKDLHAVFKGQSVGIAPDGSIWVRTRAGMGVNIQTVQEIKQDTVALQFGYGEAVDLDRPITGAYKKGTIYLQRDMAGRWTLAHESVHWMEDVGILNREDVKAVTRHIQKLHRQGKFETNNPDDVGGSEDRASFLASRLTATEQGKGLVDRIVAKIRDFVDRLANLVTRTAGGVARDIQSGRIFERDVNGRKLRTRVPAYEQAAAKWYSAMERFLEAKLPGKGAPKEWAKLVNGWAVKGQFKAEELEWSGLQEWLAGQTGTVTKAQVLDYLRENNVRVEEVVKGGDISPELQAKVDQLTEELANADIDAQLERAQESLADGNVDIDISYDNEENGYILKVDGWDDGNVYETEKEANDAADAEIYKAQDEHFKNIRTEISNGIDYDAHRAEAERQLEVEDRTSTKFEAYQEPGGENYMELVLTLPTTKLKYTVDNVSIDTEETSMRTRGDNYLFWFIRTPDQLYQIPKSKAATSQDAIDYVIQNKKPTPISIQDAIDYAIQNKKPTPISIFESPHFDEPNVLVHVRFNERTDEQGRKVLFIEEVQSDWHQAGRKKGYAGERLTDLPTGYVVEQSADPWPSAIIRESIGSGFTMYNSYGPNGLPLGQFAKRSDAENAIRPWVVRGPDNSVVIPPHEKWARREEDAREWALRKLNGLGQGVPNAPFKRTEAWSMLAMKRMIRGAAENGFDAVAWTPGAVHTRRYGTEQVLWKKIPQESILSEEEISSLKEQEKRHTQELVYLEKKIMDSGRMGNEHDKKEFLRIYNLEQAHRDSVRNRLENPKRGWLVDVAEQRGGRVEVEGRQIDIEAEAEARGLNVKYADTVTTRDELRKMIDSIAQRTRPEYSAENYEKMVDARTDKIWKDMNSGKESGYSLPRKEGFEGYYDKQLVAYTNDFVKKWGGKVEDGKVETIPGGPREFGDVEDRKENPDFRMLPVPMLVITDAMRQAALREGMPQFQVSAWHGSPYAFEKVSTEKIGSGEGAQTFGWGLYFSDLEKVGRHYANEGKKILIDGESVDKIGNPIRSNSAKEAFENSEGLNKEDILNSDRNKVRQLAEYIRQYGYTFPQHLDTRMWGFYNKLKNEHRYKEGGGNLYKVTIHKGKPQDQYTWLDWDKPIGPDLAKKVESLLPEDFVDDVKDHLNADVKEWTGAEAYNALEKFGEFPDDPTDGSNSARSASLALLRSGIDGIRYPAGSLSGMKTEAKNYVVFDQDAVTVEEHIQYSLGKKPPPTPQQLAEAQALIDRLMAEASRNREMSQAQTRGNDRRTRDLEQDPTNAELAKAVYSHGTWANFWNRFRRPDGTIDPGKFFENTGMDLPVHNPQDLNKYTRKLQTMQDFARNFPAMARTADTQFQRVGDENQYISEDAKTTEAYYDLSKKEIQRVNFALLEGDREGHIWNDTTLAQRFGLTEKQRMGYWSARRVLGDKLDWIVSTTARNVVGLEPEEDVIEGIAHAVKVRNRSWMKAADVASRTAADAKFTETVRDLGQGLYASKLLEVAGFAWGRRSYIPHSWNAEWVVRVKIGEGVPDKLFEVPTVRAKIYPTHALREKAALRAADQVIKDRLGWSDEEIRLRRADILVKHTTDLPLELFEGTAPGTIESIIESSTRSMIADLERSGQEHDAEVIATLRDGIKQHVEELYKAKGWAQHLIPRKNTLGYRSDLHNVIAEYLSGFNSYRAKGTAARRFAEDLRQINPKDTPEMWKSAKEYVSDMLGTAEGEARIFKNLVSFYFLAADLSAAVLNGTQNWTHGNAMLKGIKGKRVSEMELAKAMRDVMVHWSKDKSFSEPSKYITAAELAVFKEAKDRGYLDPAHFGEVSGIPRNKIYQSYLSRAHQALYWGFSGTESVNRMSTFLAVYRRARAANIKDPFQKAVDATNAAHFIYGRGNRPEGIRKLGALGSAAYTFMTYPVGQLVFLKHRAQDLMQARGPEERNAAMKVLGTHLAYTAAFGGLYALPFAWLARAIREMFDDPEDDLEIDLHKWLAMFGKAGQFAARAVYRGIPAAFGNDLSWRMEGTNVLNLGTNTGFLPMPIGFSAGKTVGRRLKLGYKLAKRGEYAAALFLAAPDLMRNPYLGLAAEGGSGIEGMPPIEYAPGEKATKALGFTPTRETEFRKAQEIAKAKHEERAGLVVDLADRLIQARKERDTKSQDMVWTELREYNREQKEKETGVFIRADEVKQAANRRRKAREKEFDLREPKYMRRFQKDLGQDMDLEGYGTKGDGQ